MVINQSVASAASGPLPWRPWHCAHQYGVLRRTKSGPLPWRPPCVLILIGQSIQGPHLPEDRCLYASIMRSVAKLWTVPWAFQSTHPMCKPRISPCL
jgi:hypothetical protein